MANNILDVVIFKSVTYHKNKQVRLVTKFQEKEEEYLPRC